LPGILYPNHQMMDPLLDRTISGGKYTATAAGATA
jgi:hypothetical protein